MHHNQYMFVNVITFGKNYYTESRKLQKCTSTQKRGLSKKAYNLGQPLWCSEGPFCYK